MIEGLKIVITANGEGSRMKAISPQPKHLLYYREKRVYEAIRDALGAFGPVYILTHVDFPYGGVDVIKCPPPPGRKKTLEQIRGWQNVMVVDCDIIPVLTWESFKNPTKKYTEFFSDALRRSSEYIWCFQSDCQKYGGLWADDDGLLLHAKEHAEGTALRASGLYFLKDVGATLDKMTDPNGLAYAMIGAKMILEKTFIRLGDPEDYLNALK